MGVAWVGLWGLLVRTSPISWVIDRMFWATAGLASSLETLRWNEGRHRAQRVHWVCQRNTVMNYKTHCVTFAFLTCINSSTQECTNIYRKYKQIEIIQTTESWWVTKYVLIITPLEQSGTVSPLAELVVQICASYFLNWVKWGQGSCSVP